MTPAMLRHLHAEIECGTPTTQQFTRDIYANFISLILSVALISPLYQYVNVISLVFMMMPYGDYYLR
jgi:hypothetical protein